MAIYYKLKVLQDCDFVLYLNCDDIVIISICFNRTIIE